MSAARIGVVVPARNEAELLPSCLAALRAAVAHRGPEATPVRIVVVADGCTDGTADTARAAGVPVLSGGRAGGGNVGAARDAGVRWLLADAADAGVPPERLWVTTTDADSVVPSDWLEMHETAAASGLDAVLGTVTVADWSGVPPDVADAFETAYSAWKEVEAAVHPHVHGASLGVRGSAYLACGGFPALEVGEDVALVRALERAGASILRTPASPVATSSRRTPRVSGGVGSDIARLASDLSGC